MTRAPAKPRTEAVNIFSYDDYKGYLTDFIAAQPQQGRGLKSTMAEALGCKTAYISQVFNGASHFSLEQADQLNRLLRHNPAESDFFLTLVQYGRAGTPSLRTFFKTKVKQASVRNLSLKSRMQVERTQLDLEGQMIYYSHWYYGAVHVLISIPNFQTKESISEYLRLPPERVTRILEFLTSVGLAIHENGRFTIGQTRLFIDKNSPHIPKHHANWRIRALTSLEVPSPEDLHYSAAVTLSNEDATRLRAMILEFLEVTSKLVRASKEECIRSICVDFFKV